MQGSSAWKLMNCNLISGRHVTIMMHAQMRGLPLLQMRPATWRFRPCSMTSSTRRAALSCACCGTTCPAATTPAHGCMQTCRWGTMSTYALHALPCHVIASAMPAARSCLKAAWAWACSKSKQYVMHNASSSSMCLLQFFMPCRSLLARQTDRHISLLFGSDPICCLLAHQVEAATVAPLSGHVPDNDHGDICTHTQGCRVGQSCA